jgi:PAS domain S-box-containing protein
VERPNRLERLFPADTLGLRNRDPLTDIDGGRPLAEAIVDTIREPLLVLDKDLRVVSASRSFYLTFGMVRQDVQGRPIYALREGEWNIPELRLMLANIGPDPAATESCEVEREFPAIGKRIMLLDARKIFYEHGPDTAILLAFEDITNRRAVERQVQELLREKDMLLDEMQHRVANSLQIIASILLIKARTVQSEETRLQLQDAHQRVLSVAAVQQHLHSSNRGELIELPKYLSKLCETLADSMIGDSRPISLKVYADAGTTASRQAVSIGLIVTELVMNALKHAFPRPKPDAAIIVSYKIAEADWQLTISDNGVGKPDSPTNRIKPGLGTSLIQALAKQLDARVDIASDPHGTAVSITHATFRSRLTRAEEMDATPHLNRSLV